MFERPVRPSARGAAAIGFEVAGAARRMAPGGLPSGSTIYFTPEAAAGGGLLTNGDDALAGQTEARSASGIATMILNADGSVRTVFDMNALVYKQLGSPLLIADTHDQVEAAEEGIPTPADLVSEEMQPYLEGPQGLMPGVVVFVLLTDGSGGATRHGGSGIDAVTMVDGAGRAYALRNRGLGYSVEGDGTRLLKHSIAADTLIFAPEEVQAWQRRMFFIDTATAVTPLVNDARDVYEVKSGRDMVSDEELNWFGGRGVTLVSMAIPIVAGAWFRRGAGAVEHLDDVPTSLTPSEPMIIGFYGDLSKIQDGLQAHHLNQYAAYKDIIGHEDGISMKLFGDAMNGVGTPHYNAHESLEGFWSKFREGGSSVRQRPTHLAYNRALLDSLMAAGASREEALSLIRLAIRERVEYGILGGIRFEFIPRALVQNPR